MKDNTADEALILAVAARDAAAMTSLYERHKTKTYRFVRGILKDAVLADDIVSEVFLCVWCKAAEFKFLSSVSTWILAIARNKALAAACSQTRTMADLAEAEDVADPANSPEEIVIILDRQARLRGCISRMSVKHREIIDLVYYQGQSIAEVATILSLAENTVKTRMFYARKRLEKQLRRTTKRK
jgi:RNA polymerase sigma-70 factor, ECF subfamily